MDTLQYVLLSCPLAFLVFISLLGSLALWHWCILHLGLLIWVLVGVVEEDFFSFDAMCGAQEGVNLWGLVGFGEVVGGRI